MIGKVSFGISNYNSQIKNQKKENKTGEKRLSETKQFTSSSAMPRGFVTAAIAAAILSVVSAVMVKRGDFTKLFGKIKKGLDNTRKKIKDFSKGNVAKRVFESKRKPPFKTIEINDALSKRYGVKKVTISGELPNVKQLGAIELKKFSNQMNHFAPDSTSSGIKYLKDSKEGIFELKIKGSKARLVGKLNKETGELYFNGYAPNGFHEGQSKSIYWVD